MLTGSVHREVEVFDISEAAKYLTQMILRDISAQFLHHYLIPDVNLYY